MTPDDHRQDAQRPTTHQAARQDHKTSPLADGPQGQRSTHHSPDTAMARPNQRRRGSKQAAMTPRPHQLQQTRVTLTPAQKQRLARDSEEPDEHRRPGPEQHQPLQQNRPRYQLSALLCGRHEPEEPRHHLSRCIPEPQPPKQAGHHKSGRHRSTRDDQGRGTQQHPEPLQHQRHGPTRPEQQRH